jgi:macrolide-specific efflux system membrane fusion protein
MAANRTASSETATASAAPLPGKKRGRRLVVAAAAIAVLAAGYFWYRSSNTAESDRPLTATVAYGNVENTTAAAGNLQPSNTVPVGAQVSGQLRKLHVKVGDKVEAGQLLGEIDARVQRNKVDSSRANIASAEAQIEARRSALELAKANAVRVERLYRERATSQQEYDSTMNALSSAQASLTQQEQSIVQSRATLATDETQLEYTQVFAPIDGTVVSIPLKEGTTLNATQQSPTVMSIADLSTMTVETQISEADIGKVYVGMDVYFTTLGGGTRRWYSTLRQILPTPTATNNVVTYTGLFDVDNVDGALLSGMTTQVYFVRSSAQHVLTVPIGALTFADTPSDEGFAARPTVASGGPPGGSTAGPPGGQRPPREGGFRPGNFPSGALPAGGFPAGAENGDSARNMAAMRARMDAQPRAAKVRVVAADGSIAEREIMVGVTSRVSAEVLSGLTEGEQVVAGIVQAGQANANPNQQRNQQVIFQGGGNFPGGGFPGGNFPGGGRR